MASPAPDSEIKIIERLFPLLQKSLNVDEVKPFLVQNGVITLQQCEELQMNAQVLTSAKLAEKAILMVSHHPHCASQLLKALNATETASSPESSHHQIISELKTQLDHQLMNTTKNIIQSKEWNQIDNPGASNEPVPFLNYKVFKEKKGLSEKLRIQLAVESRRILEYFTSFCICVGDILQSRGVTTDRVRALLQYRLGSKNIGEQSMKQVTEAKTIHNLLCAAEPFVSWYNYDLIAFLAKELGKEEGSAAVTDYESNFQQYLKRSIFESPPVSSIKSVPSGFEVLVVKLDWDFEQLSIQDITIFKAKLCECFGQSDPSVFILQSVEEGCVLLTLLIPSNIVDIIASVMENSMGALLEVYPKVAYIRLGPKMFNPQCSRTTVVGSRPTLHKSEFERPDSTELVHVHPFRLQSSKLSSSPVSPVLDRLAAPSYNYCKVEDLTNPDPKVQLRNNNALRQQKFKECRKSSGYYSNSSVVSVYDSPNYSQRSSLVFDSAANVQSSGYSSPVNSGKSSLLLEEEEVCDKMQQAQSLHTKLQKTHSSDVSNPASERSESPLITNTWQKTSES